MDNTKEFTHLGLCAGYGGIELGLHRVIRTLRTVALCEIEAFACANLVAKMEAGLMDCAPIWTDLKTFPWAEFRDRVDILTGGYPCQPFSAAGKRLGTEDPRHLWPFIADGIRILRPKLCFFENVEGHISLGLREVIGELGAIGYTAAWGIFSASEVGAPHQRKRVFILAVSNSLGGAAGVSRSLAWNEGIAGEFDHGSGEGGGVAITLKQGLQGRSSESLHSRRLQCEAGRSGDIAWPSRPGEPQHAWEPPRVVGGKLDHPTVGRCDGIDASSSRYVGAGTEAENLGSEATHSSCCDGKAAGTLANNHRPHAGHGEQRPERTHRDLSGGCGEAMGNAKCVLLPTAGKYGAMDETSGIPADREGSESPQTDSDASLARSGEAMGNAHSSRPRERTGQRGSGIQRVDADGGADADVEIKQPMGDPVDGTKFGVGLSELSGLSDSELAEICEWMVKTDNRTDELRLLGNGVVPATAERAFLTLMQELLKGTI